MKKVLSFSILIMLVGTVIGQSLTAKKEGKQWGFVNERDSFVVAPQYDAVGDFIGAYAWVNRGGKVKKNNLPVGGKWGLINEKGELVCPLEYDFVAMPSEELVAVNVGGVMSDNNMQGGKWGYVDVRTGKLVVSAEYDKVGNFYNGAAWVVKNKQYGLINNKGELTIGCQYESVSDCYNNKVVWLEKNGKYALSDQKGHLLTDFVYIDYSGFVENVAWVKNDESLFGLINGKGEILLQPRYIKVMPFYNNVAAVFSKAGQIGLVNTKGKEIARTVYSGASQRFGVSQFKTSTKIFSYLTQPSLGNSWIDQDGKVIARGVKIAYKITDIIPEALWDF